MYSGCYCNSNFITYNFDQHIKIGMLSIIVDHGVDVKFVTVGQDLVLEDLRFGCEIRFEI